MESRRKEFPPHFCAIDFNPIDICSGIRHFGSRRSRRLATVSTKNGYARRSNNEPGRQVRNGVAARAGVGWLSKWGFENWKKNRASSLRYQPTIGPATSIHAALRRRLHSRNGKSFISRILWYHTQADSLPNKMSSNIPSGVEANQIPNRHREGQM